MLEISVLRNEGLEGGGLELEVMLLGGRGLDLGVAGGTKGGVVFGVWDGH
jgi:hypothetical protein